MAKLPVFLILTILCLALKSSTIQAQMEETGLKIMADTLDWPMMPMSMYDSEEEDEDEDEVGGRRSLFWRRVHYYISYGALAANRIPCPPRSGRSYYTHNCFKDRTPVNPYTRGCSMITRCRR